MLHISYSLSGIGWIYFITQFFWAQYLYRLLEASQELTVLHCLLLTPAVFLLLFSFSSIFSNNFWLYGPTSCTCSRLCLSLFLCLYPLHLGLFLDLLSYPGLGVLNPSLLHPSLLFPALHIICSPLPLYDPPLYSPLLGYTFPPGCTVFLSNNLSSTEETINTRDFSVFFLL